MQQINIEYTITPSILTTNVDPVIGRWFVAWHWSAVDDVGTAYMDVGGAYGPGEDQCSTGDVLSLIPLPPANATSITLTLSPSFDLGLTRRECSFTVDLHT